MTRTLSVETPDELQDRIDEQGYAYLDDDACVVDEPPDRGWYVSLGEDGSGKAIRLTDDKHDAYVGTDTLHVRTDLETLGSLEIFEDD